MPISAKDVSASQRIREKVMLLRKNEERYWKCAVSFGHVNRVFDASWCGASWGRIWKSRYTDATTIIQRPCNPSDDIS